MPLDEELIKAIKESVQEEGQPEKVADRLIAWLEEMSKTDLSATQQSQYLYTVRQAINTNLTGEDE